MKPFYAFGRALLTLWFKVGGVRIYGRENIPDDQSLLIICNHISFGDPPAVTMVYPRQITYIAKEAFAKNVWTRWLFGALGAVFLNKDANDLAALRTALQELKAGRAVAVFPEGTRHFDQQLGEFQPGAAFIAARAQVRVLPIAVLNTGDFWRIWKRNIIVNIGQPLTLPQGEKLNSQYLERETARLRNSVAALLEQARAKERKR